MTDRRPVPGFPGYEVDPRGGLWSKRQGSWVKLRCEPRPDGFVRPTLYREGGGSKRYLHRVVLEVFAGPCPEGLRGYHLSWDRADNRASNLCWGFQDDAGRIVAVVRTTAPAHPKAEGDD